MTSRTWTNDGGIAISAANLNAMEADIDKALGVPDAALATRVVAGATKTALDAAYVNVGETVIRPKDYGAVGDGVANDAAALLSAANAAVSAGVPLFLDPKATYGLNTPLSLPAGLNMNTCGAKFKALAQTGRTTQIQVASNTVITGGLYVTTLGGTAGSGVVVQSASNVVIDVVDVASTIPGQGSANDRDNGFKIDSSSDVTVGRVKVKNFDWAVRFDTSPNLRIGWIEVDTYSCAVKARTTTNLKISGGTARNISPNAIYAPGYNGMLVEAFSPVENIHINDFTIYDAQEHGFRTSGPSPIKNVWITNCAAINCLGTGFKLLGSELVDQTYNENVFYVNCLAEDCGGINQNTNGFLIQMAKNVKIISPIVRNRNKTYCGYAGIRMGGVTQVQITDPTIINPQWYGFYLDSEYGPNSDIELNGGKFTQNIGIPVYLKNGQATATPVMTFTNIEIEATVYVADTSYKALYAGKGDYAFEGTWPGFNRLRFNVHDNVPAVVSVPMASSFFSSYYAHIIGKKNTTVAFKNGSEWLDSTNGTKYLAKAGAWAAL